MSLPGLGGFIAGAGSGVAFSSVMTVGTADVITGYDPKGPTEIHSIAKGFAVGDSVYGSFGSMTEATWAGFPIIALYQKDSDGTTIFRVTGDASALTPILKVNTVNQNLGAGSFVGGETGFSGTAADPFVGNVSRNVTID